MNGDKITVKIDVDASQARRRFARRWLEYLQR